MKSVFAFVLVLLIMLFFALPYLNILPNSNQSLSTNFTFSPTTPPSATTITFTANSQGGSPPFSYSWYFGDGYTGTGAVIDHIYSSSGQYNVSLTVTDSAGNVANSYLIVTVSQPGALTASFNYNPSTPVSGQTVTFTANPSGGVSPYNYSWNLSGTLKTGNPVTQSFTNGTYNISLNVTDSAGNVSTSSQSLTVASGGNSSVLVLVGWGGV